MSKEKKLDKETEEQLECALKAIQEEVKNDPEARKLLEENPAAMLQKHGVDARKLPAEVLESIAGGIWTPPNQLGKKQSPWILY